MHPFLLADDTINLSNVNANYTYLVALTPQDYVITIGSTLLGMAGVFAFIYMLWGGVQWIMAGGDKDAIDKGRKKITTAFIGLCVTLSVFAIMHIIRILFGAPATFVINRLGT